MRKTYRCLPIPILFLSPKHIAHVLEVHYTVIICLHLTWVVLGMRLLRPVSIESDSVLGRSTSAALLNWFLGGRNWICQASHSKTIFPRNNEHVHVKSNVYYDI